MRQGCSHCQRHLYCPMLFHLEITPPSTSMWFLQHSGKPVFISVYIDSLREFDLPGITQSLLFAVYSYDKHDDQNNIRKKRIYLAEIPMAQWIIYHDKPGQELKAIIYRQEMKQRTWKRATCWLTFCGLLGLISYATQDHLPKGGPSPNDLGSFTSIIIQKNLLYCELLSPR